MIKLSVKDESAGGVAGQVYEQLWSEQGLRTSTADIEIEAAEGVVTLNGRVRTGVLRHPLNPIGDSSSTAIQGFYLAIVATCFGLLFLLAWLLVHRAQHTGESPEGSPRRREEHTG